MKYNENELINIDDINLMKINISSFFNEIIFHFIKEFVAWNQKCKLKIDSSVKMSEEDRDFLNRKS